MLDNAAFGTTARLRVKQPVYTSDKRAKFTQRENKKWIRFCTVIGYIFFVSLPAASLSVYYMWIWNPDYISRFPADKNRNVSANDYTVRPIASAKRNGNQRYRPDLWLRSSTRGGRSGMRSTTASTSVAIGTADFTVTTTGGRPPTTTDEHLVVQRPTKVTRSMLEQLVSTRTAGQRVPKKSDRS